MPFQPCYLHAFTSTRVQVDGSAWNIKQGRCRQNSNKKTHCHERHFFYLPNNSLGKDTSVTNGGDRTESWPADCLQESKAWSTTSLLKHHSNHHSIPITVVLLCCLRSGKYSSMPHATQCLLWLLAVAEWPHWPISTAPFNPPEHLGIQQTSQALRLFSWLTWTLEGFPSHPCSLVPCHQWIILGLPFKMFSTPSFTYHVALVILQLVSGSPTTQWLVSKRVTYHTCTLLGE